NTMVMFQQCTEGGLADDEGCERSLSNDCRRRVAPAHETHLTDDGTGMKHRDELVTEHNPGAALSDKEEFGDGLTLDGQRGSFRNLAPYADLQQPIKLHRL